MTPAPGARRSTRPTDDPVHLFAAMAARHDRCFWLDGGAGRPWTGNRSVLGWLDDQDTSLSYDASRREVTRLVGDDSQIVGTDMFEVLEAEIEAGGGDGLWVGFFGYASRPDLPARVQPSQVPGSRVPGSRVPDAVWMHARNVRVMEHPVAAAPTRPAPPPRAGVVVPDSYAAAFARVQEHLHAGNTYEVNLTHRIEVAADVMPVDVYLRLRALNPAPYAGFIQHRGTCLLSSSPERYATIDAAGAIETRPIKGTTPRGATPDEDERFRRILESDGKFQAENLMIVDLLRNDLGTVCKAGTVQVPDLMTVESYSSVHQLVSTVRGQLREDVTTVSALRELFPPGSMTGAPKRRTMEVIEEVEATPRGVYSGAFGWISPDGRADLGVIIRSLTTAGDGQWQLGVGGGITVQSDMTEEYAESIWKAERLLASMGSPSGQQGFSVTNEPGASHRGRSTAQPGGLSRS